MGGLKQKGDLALPRARSLSRGLRLLKKEFHVAAKAFDKNFFVSITGPLNTWFHATDENTEWDMMRRFSKHPKDWWRLAKMLTEDLVSVFVIPIGFLLMARAVFRFNCTTEGQQFARNNESSGEDWWYINGIGVNGDLQKENAKQMSRMFEREIFNFYNPTQGLVFDLVMCMTGVTGHKTHSCKRLAKTLIEDLNKYPQKKLILIAHSGGVIITVNAIRHLIKRGLVDHLRRIEVYTFGSPVTVYVTTIDPLTYQRVPFYEHYVNTGDFVAKIGTLRLEHGNWWATGKVFAADVKGHFFGEHYLCSFAKQKYKWQDTNMESSELYRKMKRVKIGGHVNTQGC